LLVVPGSRQGASSCAGQYQATLSYGVDICMQNICLCVCSRARLSASEGGGKGWEAGECCDRATFRASPVLTVIFVLSCFKQIHDYLNLPCVHI
jgi:hypothetical protein